MVRCNLILAFCACLSLVASAENGQQRYKERPLESYGEFEVVRDNAEPMPEADSNDDASQKNIDPLPTKEPYREFWRTIFDLSGTDKTMQIGIINILNAKNKGHDKLLKDKQRRYSTWKVKLSHKGKGFDARDPKYYYYNPMMYLMELNAPDVAIALFKRLYRIDGEPKPTPKGDITWRVVRDDMLRCAMGRGLVPAVKELLEVLPIIPSDHSSLFLFTKYIYAKGKFDVGDVTLPLINCDYVKKSLRDDCKIFKDDVHKCKNGDLPCNVILLLTPNELLDYVGLQNGKFPVREDLSIYY